VCVRVRMRVYVLAAAQGPRTHQVLLDEPEEPVRIALGHGAGKQLLACRREGRIAWAGEAAAVEAAVAATAALATAAAASGAAPPSVLLNSTAGGHGRGRL